MLQCEFVTAQLFYQSLWESSVKHESHIMWCLSVGLWFLNLIWIKEVPQLLCVTVSQCIGKWSQLYFLMWGTIILWLLMVWLKVLCCKNQFGSLVTSETCHVFCLFLYFVGSDLNINTKRCLTQSKFLLDNTKKPGSLSLAGFVHTKNHSTQLSVCRHLKHTIC